LSTSLLYVHDFLFAAARLLYWSVYYMWVKDVESQQPSKDADKYKRVSLDDIETTKESGMKLKLK